MKHVTDKSKQLESPKSKASKLIKRGNTTANLGYLLLFGSALPLQMSDRRSTKYYRRNKGDKALTLKQISDNHLLETYARTKLNANLDTKNRLFTQAHANPMSHTAVGTAQNPWVSAHELGHIQQFNKYKLQHGKFIKKYPNAPEVLKFLRTPTGRVVLVSGLAGGGAYLSNEVLDLPTRTEKGARRKTYTAAGIAAAGGLPILASEYGADIRARKILKELKIRPSKFNLLQKILATGTYTGAFGLPLAGIGMTAYGYHKLHNLKKNRKSK